jgi:hypothetical protein
MPTVSSIWAWMAATLGLVEGPRLGPGWLEDGWGVFRGTYGS